MVVLAARKQARPCLTVRLVYRSFHIGHVIVCMLGSISESCRCREMLDTPGPYLLDVMVPHVQHVLPMIPGGASFKEVITTGDGTVEY